MMKWALVGPTCGSMVCHTVLATPAEGAGPLPKTSHVQNEKGSGCLRLRSRWRSSSLEGGVHSLAEGQPRRPHGSTYAISMAVLYGMAVPFDFGRGDVAAEGCETRVSMEVQPEKKHWKGLTLGSNAGCWLRFRRQDPLLVLWASGKGNRKGVRLRVRGARYGQETLELYQDLWEYSRPTPGCLRSLAGRHGLVSMTQSGRWERWEVKCCKGGRRCDLGLGRES